MNLKLGFENAFSKILKEYRKISTYLKKKPQCKIVEVSLISEIPGETIFRVQMLGRGTFPKLTAGKLINDDPELSHFSQHDAALIRAAAKGEILNFLDNNFSFGQKHRIVGKDYDREKHKYLFSIETKDGLKIVRTTDEICKNKLMLEQIRCEDLIDIGYSKAEEEFALEREMLQKARLESQLEKEKLAENVTMQTEVN